MKRQLLTLLVVLLFTGKVYAKEECGQPCSQVSAPERAVDDVKFEPMSAREIWAHIVAGEAGGLTDGAYLVAWTLRAWEVRRGMPAELAGMRWGWHGWSEPTALSWAAVNAVWQRPLTDAPYAWMQAGHYCLFLGNDTDLRYWNSLGWNLTPQYRIEWPEWGLAMNCMWE